LRVCNAGRNQLISTSSNHEKDFTLRVVARLLGLLFAALHQPDGEGLDTQRPLQGLFQKAAQASEASLVVGLPLYIFLSGVLGNFCSKRQTISIIAKRIFHSSFSIK
jgi:hypothetical protein